jgi:signal transduction histidine kinase
VWEFATILVLVAGLIAGAVWRGEDWGLVTCLFALWLTGHVLQFAAPFADSHIAGWVRLANLAALPLLAGLVYRRVLLASPARAGGAALEMAGILEAVRRAAAPHEVEGALKTIVPSIARTLEADVVALGLPAAGPAKGVRIVALHPPGTAPTPQETVLPLSRHPLLATAVQTGRLQHAPAQRQDPALAALYRALGFERPGPLLILPLVNGGQVLGVMLAGNPFSQQSWTAQDEQLCQAVGTAVAVSLANVPRPKTTGRGAELQKALGEAHRLTERVAEVESTLEQQRQRADELATRLRLREWEAANQSQTVTETAVWQEEMRALADARAVLEAELGEWREKAGQLAQAKGDLETQLLQVQAALEAAREQAASAPPVPAPDGGPGSAPAGDEATAQSKVPLSLIHELRTPMTSVIGYIDLLSSESVGILGETQRQFLQRVRANIERMGGLLNDLIRVTAIDAGQISLSPGPVDLINVIEDAIMSLSSQFSERKLAVQMDMPSELPPIRADRDSLYQIVQHLLSNASQCSKPGTEILVRARLERYEDQVEGLPDHLFMSVNDTGGGIVPDDQRRVFQRLYRADNPLIAGLGDTGVGLSIAKSLVEAQGGRIWVESEMEVGSTFSFILPLSPEDEGGRSPAGEPAEAGRGA